ncbi:MAG: hypothetical protein OSB18_01040 [SAR324 cluster bacterium]|nr:hypothetical protein [SAR324 cluster bacterium]HBI29053.1 hypothetical protein [Deltaproteobacteria bacterium]
MSDRLLTDLPILKTSRFPLLPAHLPSRSSLTVTVFEQLSEEDVEHLDQLICRFTKMQDAMGKRLFPSIHGLLEESSDPVAFLDILHRLEKLGVLTSVAEWQLFRNLRNNLAHDYPEGVSQTVDTLNLLIERMRAFIGLFKTAQKDWQRRMSARA